MKKWWRLHCRRPWNQTFPPSSSSRSSRFSPGNLTDSRFTVMPFTRPSLLVTMDSVTTRPLFHTICHIGCVWTQKSWPGGPPSTPLLRTRWWHQWLKNSPPRMNARNFSWRSWPLFRRLKFPRFLQALQPRWTCSCCVEMLSWRTSTSSPKFFLLCGRHRLRETMWWVPNQRSFRIVSVPSGKPTWWLARLWRSSRSSENPRPARKWRHPRRRLLDLQCLTAWGPRPPCLRGLWHRSHPFELAPEGPVHDTFQGSKKSGKASSATSTRQRWRVPGGGSPGRLCPALAESAGQLPGHRHRRGRGGHCIPATTSAHPSKHQFPDQEQPTGSSASRWCLADEGSHRASHQREVPGILQSVVSGTQENRRSATCNRPVHSQPPHGSTALQDGDARVRPISHQKSGVDGIDRHTLCLSSCTDASGCPQVSAFHGQQEGVPVHLSSVWTGDFSTGVHQAAATGRVAVKAVRCEATRLLRRLADQGRCAGTSSTARPDNHLTAPVSWLDHQLREVWPHTKSRLPVHRDAVQHSTFRSGTPAENAFKGPVSSSALDGQSEHNCQRSAQASRHAGVHGFAGPARTAPSSSSPMVGRHSMVPEDRELVWPDSSSTVGSVKGGMIVIPSSPARSTPRHQGDGSNSLHRCVQFGLGSPVKLTLNTGTVVSISKIVSHKRSRDAGCHLCCERLPTSPEVPSGAIDVRQRSDGGVHHERGGTRSHTLMQMTIRLLKWCDSKGITLVPIHLPGVHNI